MERIIKNLPYGFVRHRVVTSDEGEPIDYEFLDVNPAFEKMIGMEKDELLGYTVTQMLTVIKMSHFDWIDAYCKVDYSQETLQFEAYFESLERWYEVTVFSDEPNHFVTIFHDITDLKLRTEQKLQESQELFDQVLDATEDGIWEWNVKTGEAYFSDHLYTMLGYQPKEFAPSYGSWRNLLHSEDLAKADVKLGKLFQGGQDSFEIIFRAKTKGIGHKWINCRGKVAKRDENGFPVKVVGSHIDINERIEQEERYRSIINSARTIALVLTDLDLIVYEFSPGAETIFGYTREEMLGWHVNPLHNLSEMEKYPVYLEKLKRNKEGFTVETEMVRKSGEHFSALFTLEPLLDNEGEVSGTLGVTVDISAQKDIEEKLRQSEGKFRAYTEKAPLAILVFDEKGNFLEVNREACRLTGYTEAELRSISISEFLAPEFLDEGLELFEQVKADQHLETNILGRKKNGERFWANLVSTRLDESRIIGFCKDITEQIEAEEALRQSEERFRFLVENASEGILVEQEGLIKYVNPETTRVMGYSKEEILETHIKDYIYPQDRGMVLERHWKRLQDEAVADRYEFRVVRKDGDVRWVEISAGPIEWGKRPANLNLIMDITERKLSEEKIRYLSFHDTLTGLYNRAYLEEEMKRLDTERQLPIGIIMVDLNGLKLINDTYGHHKGDELLVKAAKIITSSCRREDLVARWGGDEFLIFLPNTKKDELEVICQRIGDNSRGVSVEGIPVSLALGAEVKELSERSLEEVLKKAEDNMYHHKFMESRRVKNNVLSAFLQSLSAKSYETEMHTHYMTILAWQIGEEMGLSYSDLNRLSLVVSLHDVGKVSFPEKTLTKEGPLTEDEWEAMKAHPEIGYRIILATEDFAYAAEEVLYHHEWWDGRGYPRGIKGKEIPLLSRITAVVDAYEVMTSGRPYRNSLTQEEALEECKKWSGTQFDPQVVEILGKIL